MMEQQTRKGCAETAGDGTSKLKKMEYMWTKVSTAQVRGCWQVVVDGPIGLNK